MEKEQIIAKYTRLIHPQDLGSPTSKLENILRDLVEEIIELSKSKNK